MDDSATSSVEFLGFLADISCPATGYIDMARLGAWLGLTRAELEARWISSGRESWAHFADEILSVLDVMQDETMDLATTLAWYRHESIAPLGQTADEAVTNGCAPAVVKAIRGLKVTHETVAARKHA